jgi:HSP20 family protein
MDRFFDRFFQDFNLPSFFAEESEYLPAFDISEKEDEYVVKAELPGIDVKDLDIQFSNGLLTVKGQKKQEKEDKGENYHRIERRYGSFQRSFRIPDNIQEDKIGANYKDGILTLTLPKDAGGKVKKIEVKH